MLMVGMILAVGRVKIYGSDDILENRKDDGSGAFQGFSN